ncbi:MAG: hypothetical protein AAFQ67_03030 [Pseudomonadota bacterium]
MSDASSLRAGASAVRPLMRGDTLFASCLVAVFVAGWLYLSPSGPHTADVSWLIQAADRMLSGDRLYVDVWESNPPFSVWLYLPMAALEHATGLRAEVWTSIAMFVALAGALAMTARIAHISDLWARTDRQILLLAAAIAVLFVSPAQFGQREQFGVIGALPFLTVIAARIDARSVPIAYALAAGLLGGVIMLVKPHYCLGYGAALLGLMVKTRAARPHPEIIAAACLVIAYAFVALWLHPEYVSDVLPVMVDTYLGRRNPSPSVWIYATFAVAPLALLRKTDFSSAAVLAFAAASIGFLASYVVMGKGWTYHLIPSATFALLAAAAAAMARRQRGANGEAVMALVAGVAMLGAMAALYGPRPAIERPITGYLKGFSAQPRLAVLSTDIDVGNPLARAINASWTERDNADYIPAFAAFAARSASEPQRAQFDGYFREGLDRQFAYIASEKPDILILEPDDAWPGLVAAEPRYANMIDHYSAWMCDVTLVAFVRNDHFGAPS